MSVVGDVIAVLFLASVVLIARHRHHEELRYGHQAARSVRASRRRRNRRHRIRGWFTATPVRLDQETRHYFDH